MKPTIEDRIKAFKEANPDISQGLYAVADLVAGAVMAKYDEEDHWCYVEEIYEDHVIMRKDGKYWRITYEVVEGDVLLSGDMKEVEKKVTYEGDRGSQNGQKREIKENRKAGELFKESQFDSESLIIRNVSLLGAVSANGYTFKESAMKDAARLLEGAIQYTNHTFDELPRDVNSSFSECKNVRYDASKDKVYGDMYLVDTPFVREELFPRIERFSHKFGNSIVAFGESVKEENGEFVVSLSAVESCDLVSDPATNKGLFESVIGKNTPGGGLDMKFTAKDVRENKEVFDELKADILKEIKDGETVESLKKENARLEGDNKKLTERVDGFERDKKIAEKAEFIARQIKDAKLPEIAVTETWKKMLLNMDETDIKIAVSELSESVRGLTVKPYNFEKVITEGASGDSVPSAEELAKVSQRLFN